MAEPATKRFRRVLTAGAVLVMLAACTAVGASRTRRPELRDVGPMAVRTDGAVIDNVRVNGAIDVYASHVTVRNARVLCGDYWCIRTHDGATHLTVEDADIGPVALRPGADGLWVHSFTGRRLDIHGVSDGVKAWSDVHLEDSRIHDLAKNPDDHSDGVQVQAGSRIVVERNVIEGGTNSAVFLSSDSGGIADVTIRDNALAGGAFTVAVRSGPYGPPEQVTLKGNAFGAAQYGAVSTDVALDGGRNVDARTGRPVVAA